MKNTVYMELIKHTECWHKTEGGNCEDNEAEKGGSNGKESDGRS
jgi:hypothetical protein